MPNNEKQIVSEEVYEVINSRPPWILRNGLLTIFLIIASLLVGSAFIKYPESILVPIKILPEGKTAKISLNGLSPIDTIFITQGQHVNTGQKLVGMAQLHNNNEGKTFNSPIGGRAYISYDFNNETTILEIIPDFSNQVIWGSVGEAQIDKVKIGQRVRIQLTKYNVQEMGYLYGNISAISSFPIDQMYSIKITLDSTTENSRYSKMLLSDKLNGNADIEINDISIFRRIFKKFLRFN